MALAVLDAVGRSMLLYGSDGGEGEDDNGNLEVIEPEIVVDLTRTLSGGAHCNL
jgi:hypothetical protein